MDMVTLTSEQLREAAALKEQIEEAQDRLAEILEGAPVSASVDKPAKKGMSPKARKAIGEAQRARWAKFHAAKAAAAAAAPAVSTEEPVVTPA